MIKVLHLTVDHEGNLMLWKSRQEVVRGKRLSERYVMLTLTPQQQSSIENMRQVAENFVKAQEAGDASKPQ